MLSRFFFGLIPETEPAETRVDERNSTSFFRDSRDSHREIWEERRTALNREEKKEAITELHEKFVRAKAAVIEAAILVSRLDMLPRDKIEKEIAYLQIAVGKTAGAAEQEAWQWLIDLVEARYPGLCPP